MKKILIETVAQKVTPLLKKVYYLSPVCSAYTAFSWERHRRCLHSQHGQLQLHIGAGNHILDGWTNIDLHPGRRRLSLKLPEDLKKILDNSAKYIYASHFLEHLSYPEEALVFLKDCRRILTPGGALRIVVPDIEQIIVAYATDDSRFFETQASLHPSWCTTKLDHLLYGILQNGEHKYGYDAHTLGKLLLKAGYSTIDRNDYRQSRISDLNIDYRDETDGDGRSLHLFMDAICEG